ncbi:MAG: hypothetical protein JNL97_16095 [Verrucomicrobiales bacterium]|nr:hypothetical protein [Verrucomicrobiales bacterium]
MRRPAFILVLTAILLALGLFAPRVARHWRHETDPRDAAGGTTPGLSGNAPRAPRGEMPERGAPVRDQWRRSRGTEGVFEGSLADRVGAASGAPELSWLAQLLDNDGGAKPVSRETADRWRQAGHTNAADLLALRQAGAGSEYLEAALRQFPDDPRVLLASTSLRETSEVVRERMDRFREADPKNALADYLSAWNELAAGNREKALEHLTAAAAKPSFEDYTADAARAAEELYRFEGRSEAEARAVGSSGVLLPHLAHLKSLSGGLADLQKELVGAGDLAGAEHVAKMGLRLGKQLTQGPGSSTIVGELVGIAVEANLVRSLPQDTPYEFLGGDAATYQQNLKQRRADIRSVSGQFESWIRQASEADVVAYFDVWAKHGERTALEWVRDQAEPKAP